MTKINPAIVLLHAFPLSSEMWASTVAELESDGYRVIAPDLPGFGAAQGTIDTIEHAAHFVFKRVLDEGIENAVYCGISMGGYILFEILKQQPETVSAAVFCDTTFRADTAKKKKARMKSIDVLRKNGGQEYLKQFPASLVSPHTITNKPEVYRSIVELSAAANKESVCAALKAMAERQDYEGLLDSVKCPVKLVYGADDAALTDGIALNDLLPGAHLTKIPKTGHYSCMESPDEFNKALLEFIHSL